MTRLETLCAVFVKFALHRHLLNTAAAFLSIILAALMAVDDESCAYRWRPTSD